MYCNQCRRSIPDGSRYCNFCGADQKGQKSSGKSWLVSLAVFVVVLSVLYVLDNNSLGSNSNKAVAEKLAVGQDTTATFMQQEQQENNLQSISLTVAAEPRQLGDGGYCAVFETLTPVNDCKQVTLTLEAEGNHGATTKGNWEVHFRIGGQWKKIQTIYYGGAGQEDFTIHFSPAASFDAVCAFPTQRGNYSYQSSMALSDAYCD